MRSIIHSAPIHTLLCNIPAVPNPSIFPESICCGVMESIRISIVRFCFSPPTLLNNIPEFMMMNMKNMTTMIRGSN